MSTMKKVTPAVMRNKIQRVRTWVNKGKTIKWICERVGISPHYVKKVRTEIKESQIA